MSNLLILPPLVFVLVFIAVWLFSKATAGIMAKGADDKGKGEPYACGEEFNGPRAEPEYGQFFPFAVFFTILHVAALMLASWAVVSGGFPIIGIVYALAVMASLAVIFAG